MRADYQKDIELYKESVGNIIKQIRKEQHISQQTLANKAMIAQSTVLYIEKGIKSPSIDMLLKICNGLSINIIDLLILVEDMEETRFTHG